MIVEVKMPDLSTTGKEMTVVEWLAQVGQPVQQGQPILSVETDKAVMEVESFVAGILKETLVAPEDEVRNGQLIALVEVQDAALPEAPAASEPSAKPNTSQLAATASVPAAAPPRSRQGMFARNRQHSTQGGQERTAEGVAAPESQTNVATGAGGAETDFALSPTQQIVARRMKQSKQTIPHFYLQTSFDATAITARRNETGPEKIVWEAFFVRAAARALRCFPRMAARFEDDRLVKAEADALGVAVDVDGDLFVLAVHEGAERSPLEISRQIRQGVQRLKSGDGEARRLQPAVMTVTNLGACEVEAFIPIINPPEAAILAIGKIAPAVVPVNGEVSIQPRATLTLAVDHRVVNGKYAAGFLDAIVKELEAM